LRRSTALTGCADQQPLSYSRALLLGSRRSTLPLAIVELTGKFMPDGVVRD
jgi:hypothetical protein